MNEKFLEVGDVMQILGISRSAAYKLMRQINSELEKNRRENMSETNEKWSNLEETAEYLGVTKDTIRSWIKKTDIPAHKIGRLWKFKFSEVDEWVKSGKSAL